MGAKLWYEVTCDGCGCAEHFLGNYSWKNQAISMGWIVKGNKAFCNEDCENKFKVKKIKP